MDFTRAGIIVGLALILVVVINVALYLALTRKNAFFEITLFRKAADRARDPWKVENDALDELSQRVAQLKAAPGAPGSSAEDPDHGK